MVKKCIRYSISYKRRGERLLANIVESKVQAETVKKSLKKEGKEGIQIKKRNLCY